MNEEKSIVVYTDNETDDELNDVLIKEAYAESCGISVEEVDDEKYYDWVYENLLFYWRDFIDAVKKHLSNNMCIITGKLGLWDGKHEIKPEICDSTLEALDLCFSIRGEYYKTVSLEDDGSLTVEVSHHDGCNVFTLRLVAPESEELADYIKNYGEDEEYRFEDIVYEKYEEEDFML